MHGSSTYRNRALRLGAPPAPSGSAPVPTDPVGGASAGPHVVSSCHGLTAFGRYATGLVDAVPAVSIDKRRTERVTGLRSRPYKEGKA